MLNAREGERKRLTRLDAELTREPLRSISVLADVSRKGRGKKIVKLRASLASVIRLGGVRSGDASWGPRSDDEPVRKVRRQDRGALRLIAISRNVDAPLIHSIA